jgi:nucleoside-diphosphate-sugar epimerase
MTRIAVFGGTGYLATLIKNQNNVKENRYTFFSRKKSAKNYINYFLLKKNSNILNNFDFVIHLAGPNQNQLSKNKFLIKKKNQITSNICDLCLSHNIRLIYISSMQAYKDYGKKNISINSKTNLINPYSKSHYESEKIIKSKFLNHKKMFTILRMGNVFGFEKNINLKKINDNLIHSLCNIALKKKQILIQKGYIQRTFIPSQIFLEVINSIIKKELFKNSVVNISYKNLNLKNIAEIIQKRLKLIFNIYVDVIIKNMRYEKKCTIYSNRNFRFKTINEIIYTEIDQILKFLLKNT